MSRRLPGSDDPAQLRLMIRDCIEELLVARDRAHEDDPPHRLVLTVEGTGRSIEVLRRALQGAGGSGPAEIRVNGPVGPFAHVTVSTQPGTEAPTPVPGAAGEPDGLRARTVPATPRAPEPAEVPAPTPVLSGVVTEADVSRLPTGTTRAELAAGTILTPLARDRLRSRKVRVVRLDDA